MATPLADKQLNEQRELERQTRSAAIGKYVLHNLGQPESLQGVHVRPLWEDHYRVNIVVGMNAASASVAHSYFLVADGDGRIVSSSPSITRRY